jgi:hypothetical protein
VHQSGGERGAGGDEELAPVTRAQPAQQAGGERRVGGEPERERCRQHELVEEASSPPRMCSSCVARTAPKGARRYANAQGSPRRGASNGNGAAGRVVARRKFVIVRDGARAMLAAALQVEVAAYVHACSGQVEEVVPSAGGPNCFDQPPNASQITARSRWKSCYVCFSKSSPTLLRYK